jgi:hypothetical protein
MFTVSSNLQEVDELDRYSDDAKQLPQPAPRASAGVVVDNHLRSEPCRGNYTNATVYCQDSDRCVNARRRQFVFQALATYCVYTTRHNALVSPSVTGAFRVFPRGLAVCIRLDLKSRPGGSG